MPPPPTCARCGSTEAKAIYRAKYWAAQRCDELPAGVDYAVFDYGVNCGIGRSGKVLRRVSADDHRTRRSRSLRAGAAARSGAQSATSGSLPQALKTWPVFGAGWGRRVAEVRGAGHGEGAHGDRGGAGTGKGSCRSTGRAADRRRSVAGSAAPGRRAPRHRHRRVAVTVLARGRRLVVVAQAAKHQQER